MVLRELGCGLRVKRYASPAIRHKFLLLGLLLAGNRLRLALASSSVMACVLAANRQTAAVPQTPIGANLDEAANVALNLSSQVTFDLVIAVQDLAKMSDFGFAQVANLLSGIDTGLFTQLENVVLADAINEREGVLSRFIPRKVDTCDTCHKFVFGSRLIRCGFADQAVAMPDIILGAAYAWG